MKKEDVYLICLKNLAQNKLESFSLTDLADELKIKKPSLYSYCDSKEDLIKKSLKYAEDSIKISNYNVNFDEDTIDILKSVVFHYLNLFFVFFY